MIGKNDGSRTQSHFVHIYSKVPYLDSQIFNCELSNLRESKKTKMRTDKAIEGLQRVRVKSQMLSQNLKNSRKRRAQDEKKFKQQLQISQKACLQKQKQCWKDYTADKRKQKINNIKDQKYLDDILLTNSTKAASRINSVRRWT